jgi:hypothetical protein
MLEIYINFLLHPLSINWRKGLQCTNFFMLCTRLPGFGSFGGRKQSSGDLRMAKLLKAQVRLFIRWLLGLNLVATWWLSWLCCPNFYVVWESEQWKKHLILKRIVEYILLRHLSISKTSIEQTVDQLDFSLLHGVEGDEINHLLLVGFPFFLHYFCNVPFRTEFYNF